MKKKTTDPRSFARIALSLCLVAALTTTVVPVLSADRQDLVRDVAFEDCCRIEAALGHYVDDTQFLPTGAFGKDELDFLVGSGPRPDGLDTGDERIGTLARFLEEGDATECGSFWAGPYKMRTEPDPWGNAYVVASSGFRSGTAWVLSAGPNGIVETDASSRELGGDDVGVRYRN